MIYYKKINTELNTLKTLNAMVIDKLKKTNIESEEDFISAKEALLEKQREYYKSGSTIPVKFRIEQLKKLYATVKKYENAPIFRIGASYFID